MIRKLCIFQILLIVCFFYVTEWKWIYLQKDNYNWFYVDRSSSQYLNFWQKKEDFTEIMNCKIGWAFHNPCRLQSEMFIECRRHCVAHTKTRSLLNTPIQFYTNIQIWRRNKMLNSTAFYFMGMFLLMSNGYGERD